MHGPRNNRLEKRLCALASTSYNTLMATNQIYITKFNGEREIFEPEKLKKSLARAGASSHYANQVVSHIESELQDGMSTSVIYDHAFKLLHKLERPVALRYSLRKAISELGPSGFPFEKSFS